MKRLLLVLSIALALSTVAQAIDIAISTPAGWMSQGAADREAQEIVANVTEVAIEVFTGADEEALADWIQMHTGNDDNDLLILFGQIPNSIFAGDSSQPDGSLVEMFLDDGNTIVNTGDYMFYVSTAGTYPGDAALQNIMDITMSMWDGADVVVTAEAADYTPTLTNYNTPRPWHLDQLTGDWYAELVLAQNEAGTLGEPAIIRNAYTGGRLGTFYQTANIDDEPRGEVISEWINNWYLPIGTVDTVAMNGTPTRDAVIAETVPTLQWHTADAAAFHGVYLSESFDEVNDRSIEAVVTMEGSLSVDQIPAYAEGLTPGQTYYWAVDAIAADGTANPGAVWSFMVQPITAWQPTPADGAVNVKTDGVLGWAAGTGALYHVFYMGESFDDVNDATTGGTYVFNLAYAPLLETSKTYYWRIDEFTGVDTIKGLVWSFTTVPAFDIVDPNLVGWWGLDEGQGLTAIDKSGYGNHGTLMGSPEWIDGFIDGALQFEIGDYVDCGTDAADEVTDAFTLAAWAKNDPGTAGHYGGLGGKLTRLDSGEYLGFALVRHSSNVFRMWIGDGTADLGAIGSDDVYTDTEWHHVVGAHEGQTNMLYVDGVLQSATLEKTLAPSENFFHIGRQYAHLHDRYFRGTVDDVRIYNEVLTTEEIAEIITGDTIYFERFDAYDPNSQLAGQGGWAGWDGDAAYGALATDANDVVGPGAVEILGTSDLVQQFDVTGGTVEFSAMQYIPSGTTGTTYFILLNTYTEGGDPKDWSIQTMFNLETGAITSAYDADALGTIVYDQWVEFTCVIDLDNNTVSEYYNGALLTTHTWDAEGEYNTLQAIDLYGADASSIYYDDIKIR